jgi:hypothetical protein
MCVFRLLFQRTVFIVDIIDQRLIDRLGSNRLSVAAVKLIWGALDNTVIKYIRICLAFTISLSESDQGKASKHVNKTDILVPHGGRNIQEKATDVAPMLSAATLCICIRQNW